MENYQQQLMDLMVKKVLSKHKVKPVKDLSKGDKEKVKRVVEEIQADVEKFLENQNKKVSEKDFQNQNKVNVEPTQMNPVVKESLRKIIKSNNDLNKVKTFFNKLDK